MCVIVGTFIDIIYCLLFIVTVNFSILCVVAQVFRLVNEICYDIINLKEYEKKRHLMLGFYLCSEKTEKNVLQKLSSINDSAQLNNSCTRRSCSNTINLSLP